MINIHVLHFVSLASYDNKMCIYARNAGKYTLLVLVCLSKVVKYISLFLSPLSIYLSLSRQIINSDVASNKYVAVRLQSWKYWGTPKSAITNNTPLMIWYIGFK